MIFSIFCTKPNLGSRVDLKDVTHHTNVSAADVKIRRIMVQLPTLVLSYKIVGRLSSRPIKSDVFSDVSAAGVKTRRIMIQLPTLELSCKIVGRLSSRPIKSEVCQQYAGERNLDLTLRPHL